MKNKLIIGGIVSGLLATGLYAAPNKNLVEKVNVGKVISPNKTNDMVKVSKNGEKIEFFKIPEVNYTKQGNEAERLEEKLGLKGDGSLKLSINKGKNFSYNVKSGKILGNFKDDILKYRNNTTDSFLINFKEYLNKTKVGIENNKIPKPVVMNYDNGKKVEVIKNRVIRPLISNNKIEGLNSLDLKSETGNKSLELKIKSKYEIYFDSDEKKDKLKVFNLKTGTIVKVDYGNGTTNVYSLDKVRSDILKTFEFTDRDGSKVVKKYLMAVDGSGKEALKFMIETNDKATRMVNGKNYNANTQTRLSNSGAVIGLVDKIANAEVRGEYIVKNFIKKNGNKIFVKNNKFARNVYSGSFSDDVSFGRWFGLGFVANSAIYTTFTSDFLPRIEEDSALAQSRGANMNTYAVEIQKGGKEKLLENTLKSYNNLVEMYKGNLAATKTKMIRNQF